MKKKPYIILIGLVVLYFVVSISILLYQKMNTTYLIFSDSINLKIEKNISILNNNKIPNYNFQITQNGQIISKGKIKSTSVGMTYNNTLLEEDQIGYRGKIKPVIYENDDITEEDYEYLNSILKNNGVTVDIRNITNLYKYKIDINQDQINETVYVVSNNYDMEAGDLFSIVIIKEKNIILEFQKFSDEYSTFIPYLYFVDLKKDGEIDLIIKSVYSSMIGQKIKILSFQNNLEYNNIYEEVYKYET